MNFIIAINPECLLFFCRKTNMEKIKLINYFKGEEMSTYQYLAISLSAMSAGAALSAAVISFFTSNPQPVVSMGIIGISCVLSAASSVVIALGSKSQYDRHENRINNTNSWFNEWMSSHDHENALAKVIQEQSASNSQNEMNKRLDVIDSQFSKIEDKVNNLTVFIDKAFAANLDR